MVEVCSYVGLRSNSEEYSSVPSDQNVCRRHGSALLVALPHQGQYCLSGQHHACPIYQMAAANRAEHALAAESKAQSGQRLVWAGMGGIGVAASIGLFAFLAIILTGFLTPLDQIDAASLPPVAITASPTLQVIAVTAEPTQTSTPTATETPSATPTLTETLAVLTLEAVETASPTIGPSRTPSRTVTRAPSATRVSTNTPQPAASNTPSMTPSATNTLPVIPTDTVPPPPTNTSPPPPPTVTNPPPPTPTEAPPPTIGP